MPHDLSQERVSPLTGIALTALERGRGGAYWLVSGEPSAAGAVSAADAAVAVRRALLRALFHRIPHPRAHGFQGYHAGLLDHRGRAGPASGGAAGQDDAA